jgi:hypothetical protein
METLVFPPDSLTLNNWITKKAYFLTGFQKEMFLKGFPYSIFINNIEELNLVKDKLLCRQILNNKDVFDILSVPYNSVWDRITEEYISLFMKNYQFNENIIIMLSKLKENARLCLVSNLYSVYKPLISLLNFDSYFDQILLSCDIMERKPSLKVLKKTKYKAYENRIFIGDNWHSDLIIPIKCGFFACLLDDKNLFINTLYQKGVAFLLEKDEGYKVKRKYKEICFYYLSPVLDIDHITADELEIVDNKLYFSFMKRVKIINSLEEIYNIVNEIVWN